MGKLYIVSTPIGNLGDITLRAIEILSSIKLVACEDTRKTGWLLKNLNIENRPELISFFEGNEIKKIPLIINWLLQNQDVALVTNAGTPTISDPGFKLVREALVNQIEVISIPGPSALTASLSVAGLPTDKFLFIGFLPKKAGKRQKILQDLKLILKIMDSTVIIYESPFRLLKTFEELKNNFGDIELVVCRELTKVFEEKKRGKIAELMKYFQEKAIKGEITLLFNLKEQLQGS